jgi:hypothetical protein
MGILLALVGIESIRGWYVWVFLAVVITLSIFSTV